MLFHLEAGMLFHFRNNCSGPQLDAERMDDIVNFTVRGGVEDTT